MVAGAAVLSWPLSFTGYQLQSTTNQAPTFNGGLLEPPIWLDQTNAVLHNDQWDVTIPFSSTNLFFHLSNGIPSQ
jgi:hypothetical protein